MKVWLSYICPSTGCASAIERTSYARDVFTGSQAAELLLPVDQAPDEAFFNSNDANTDDAAQRYNLFLNDHLPFSPISAEPHPQYGQPNLPPTPQHVQRGHDPYDHPGSSSTTVGGPGFSLDAGINEPPGLERFNTGMASSSEQMLDAGPSLLAAQEQSPTTQEASRTYGEKLRAKKERDKLRKRGERSTNTQDFASICGLLNIDLLPKNTLANRSESLCVILVRDVECFVFRSSESC